MNSLLSADMTIDFTPVPPTSTIPKKLRDVIGELSDEEAGQLYEWLDSTPKADMCIMTLIEETHWQS